MIRINLAPIEEIDNQYWWIPDAAIFALVLALSVTGVKYYLGMTKDEIERLTQEQATMADNLQAMQAESERHRELTNRVKEMEQLRASVSRITESKLARYLPIILLEHIQNLKPEGVWLTGIRFKTSGGDQPMVDQNGKPVPQKPGPVEIEITGQAYDNVILAEFMTLLKATRNQDFDAADLRTQAFFDAIGLYFSDVASQSDTEKMGSAFVNFKLGVTYQERAESKAVDMQVSQILERFRHKKQ